jgi:hypothetical protein
MVAKKQKSGNSSIPIKSEERIARLLALIVIKDIENNNDRVRTLRASGFEVTEIAGLLGMSENAVAVADHRAKKQNKK